MLSGKQRVFWSLGGISLLALVVLRDSLLPVALAGLGVSLYRLVSYFCQGKVERALATVWVIPVVAVALLSALAYVRPFRITDLSVSALFISFAALLYLGATRLPAKQGVPERRNSLLLGLAAGAGFLISGLAMTVAQDNDGFLARVLQASSGQEVSAAQLRPGFSAAHALLASATGISETFIFRWLFVVAMAAMAAWLVLYIARTRSHPAALLTAVAILAQPVLMVEGNIIRPQVVLLVITPAFLLFLNLAAQKLRLDALFWALVCVGVGVLSHELSLLYALVWALVATYVLIQVYGTKHLRPRRELLLGCVVLAPYLFLLPLDPVLEQARGTLALVAGQVQGFRFEWWFIDSYSSIDNVQLGWPGYMALLYYLYNGILFAGVLAAGLWLRRSARHVHAYSTYLFLGLFLLIAEVLPRFGYTFLLNRSWPFIALALVVTASLSLPAIKNRWILGFLVVSGVFGAAASLAVQPGVTTKEDIHLVQGLSKDIPKEAILVSYQPNETPVKIYAGFDYLQLSEYEEGWSAAEILEASERQRAITRYEIQERITTAYLGSVIESVARERSNRALPSKDPLPTVGRPVYLIQVTNKNQGLGAARLRQYTGSSIPTTFPQLEVVLQNETGTVWRLQ